MAFDIAGTVGQENMNIEAKDRVISLLRQLPTSAIAKRYIFARWLRLLGREPTAAELNLVASWSQQ